jgi:hypothetical protein
MVDARDLVREAFQQLAINLWCVVTLHLRTPKPLNPHFTRPVHQNLGHIIARQPFAKWR